MAITIIPTKIQRIWAAWNLRGSVLVSLFFQILLICCAPSRKRTASYKMHIVIWSAYLLADWVAAFAVGLISSAQGEKCEKVIVPDALAAFWAPFLLLHLGGPDTITAFALEDNELWIRHMFGLIAQLLTVAYVFSQSIPNDFWLPTVLVFFAGSIKYAERTRAFYLACLGNFKDSMLPEPDPGPNYAQLMEEFTAKKKAEVPAYIHRVPEPEKVARALDLEDIPEDEDKERKDMDDIQIIQHGHRFFSIFKGLIVDHMFSFLERDESLKFFLPLRPREAFKLMEVELNFMFDALFTKTAAVHNEVFGLGYILRFTCTALIVAAFVLFTMHDKRNIHRFDIGVTQALLVGAIFLEFIALIKHIFSDWTIALLGHLKIFSRSIVFNGLRPESFIRTIQRRISFSSRWSKTVYQHSLISYCLKKQSRLVVDIADRFGLKEILEEMLYKGDQKVDDELFEFIFKELKGKAENAKETNIVKEICSARGEWALSNLNNGVNIPMPVLLSVREDIDYDQSVLTWHIATELCFFTNNNINDGNKKWSNLCKLLSDYLLYLLTMRPTMMSSVAGIAQIRFQDTCAEAKKFFFQSQSKLNEEKARQNLQSKLNKKEACLKLLEVKTEVKPVEVKGDRCKSVLFDGCILAKELMTLQADMWEIMSKVWLELLCYGASHCRGDAHAQQLSKGGELVTFVWLLMAHFGLGEQFRIEAGHARAKLVVEK